MVALLSAILLAQQLDPSFDGVWISTDNQVFVLTETGYHTHLRNEFFTIDPVTPVDNGGYYGKWVASKKLTVDLNARIESYSTYPGITVQHAVPDFAQVGVGEPPGLTGDLRLTFGYPGANGAYNSVHLNLRDSYGTEVCNALAYYAGKSTKINIFGTYNNPSKHMALSVQESDGRSVHSMQGTFTDPDGTFSFYGLRRWDRGTFVLIDRDNGKEVGHGWLVWDPSADCVNKLKGNFVGPTDQIQFYVSVRGIYEYGSLSTLTRI